MVTNLLKKARAFCSRILEPQTEINSFVFFSSFVVMTGIACLLHLFWYSQNFYSITWDESGRTLDAYNWIINRNLLNIGSWWLPFYRIVVGLALEIYPNLFLTPRIISFIFGLISLWAVSWLAYELFNDKQVALVTLVIATFFSVRLVLGLVPLSSIMFTTLILISMAFFTRWVFLDRDQYLLLSAFFFAISGTIRYEGWIFSVTAFAIIIILKAFGKTRVYWPEVGLFLLLILFFPLFSMFYYTAQTGNPFNFLKGGSTQYPLITTVLFKNPLLEFIKINAFSLNIIGLISVAYFFKHKFRLRVLIIIPSTALVIISGVLLLNQSAQSGPSWRMTGVWSMLLLPFTAYLILNPEKLLGEFKFNHLLRIGLFSLILFSFTFQTYKLKMASVNVFPESNRILGHYLEDILTLDPKAKMLIESSQYFYLNILVASQHPHAFVLNAIPERPQAKEPLLTPNSPINRGELAKQNIKYLVFKTDLFTSWLDQNPEVEKIKQFEAWSVYKIKY